VYPLSGTTVSTCDVGAVNAVGITVPGSISEQKFETVPGFITDGQTHVMVLRLMGKVGGAKIEKPVTIKTKTECPTCGTKSRFGTKFCPECGTSLIDMSHVTA
jgi:ribosomal protein S27AE